MPRMIPPAAAAILALGLTAPPAAADPHAWLVEWPEVNFAQTTVPYDEIDEGGPPRDGIPAIFEPQFLPVGEETRIDGREPVMTVERGDTARAYPIRYLMWHEIVNDEIDGMPIAITWCPTCNSGVTFDARVDGERRSFGVTGKLRHSNLIMYDRETVSWWMQGDGQGIVGEHAGDWLRPIASWTESWDSFRERNPDGEVLDQPDWPRDYGRNPYGAYEDRDTPIRFTGLMPRHGIHPMARMVRVGERGWLIARLQEEGEISEAGVTLRWSAGMASPLDAPRIEDGRDVGMVRVTDEDGNDLPHDVLFAYAFDGLFPEGEWMLAQE